MPNTQPMNHIVNMGMVNKGGYRMPSGPNSVRMTNYGGNRPPGNFPGEITFFIRILDTIDGLTNIFAMSFVCSK